MLHSPKAEEGRKLYRFERGVEDPVILLLKGVEGRLEDFCVIKATSLYTSFPAYTHPMGIGQEKEFSYASSSLWRETEKGKDQNSESIPIRNNRSC